MIPSPSFFEDWKLWASKVVGLLQKADAYFNLTRIFNPAVTFAGVTVTASTVEYDPRTGRLSVDVTFNDPGVTVNGTMAGIDLSDRTQMEVVAGSIHVRTGAGTAWRGCRYNTTTKLLLWTALAGDTRVTLSVVI